MRTRTCPHCGYKYSLRDYSHLLLNFVFTEFNCKNCHRRLTINFARRIIVAIAFACFYVALFSLKNLVLMTPLRWTGLLAIYIFGSLFIFTFDTFKKVEKFDSEKII